MCSMPGLGLRSQRMSGIYMRFFPSVFVNKLAFNVDRIFWVLQVCDVPSLLDTQEAGQAGRKSSDLHFIMSVLSSFSFGTSFQICIVIVGYCYRCKYIL